MPSNLTLEEAEDIHDRLLEIHRLLSQALVELKNLDMPEAVNYLNKASRKIEASNRRLTKEQKDYTISV